MPNPAADPDLATAAFLASVEVLAVDAFTTVRAGWAAGTLDDPPAALARGIGIMLEHHTAALAAWNGTLTEAGQPVVATPPVDAAASLNLQLGISVDPIGVTRVLFSLERLVAATYLDALGRLASGPAIQLAGSILSTDRQHMSGLLFALGTYPVPETFATTEFAYTA